MQNTKPLPAWPDTWYIVTRAKDIAPGKIFSGEIAGRSFVIFRAQSGALAAIDAHCPHMGAHLAGGQVVGEQLRCSLHNGKIDHHGNLDFPSKCKQKKARVWPVAERFGLVFLFAGSGAAPDLPCPADMAQFEWLPGKPVLFRTDWYALMINGFDILHMKTIHQRELIKPPQFILGAEGALHFHYTTRVTPGGGLSSWLMKRLSNNRIQVHQSCFGTIMLVESDLGSIRSCAIFGFVQEGDTAKVFSSFGAMRRGIFSTIKLWLTRRFYIAFLRKDYPVVKDMRIIVDEVDDPGVIALRDFLHTLPVLK